jgi:PAS domain S-box-containing protein
MSTDLNREQRIEHRLCIAAAVCAVLVIVSGVSALLGWTIGSDILKSLMHPERVAMNPATAVCFILLGSSLLMQRRNDAPSAQLWIGRCLAALVVALAGWRLIAYGMHIDGVVDRILFRAQLDYNVMALNTAIAMLMLGVALLLYDWGWGSPRRFHLSQVLLLAAVTICIFCMTGYLYNASMLYSARGSIPMALNTSITISILCTGMLCARPRRQPMQIAISPTLGGTVARRLIPASLLVPLILGWIRVYGEERQWYTGTVGVSLFALSNAIVFNLLIWWCARVLQNADGRRQQAEEQVRLSEERNRAIMQQSADAIYLVDLATRKIIDWNPALQEMLGYSSAAMEKLTVYDIVFDERHHVDERMQHLIDANAPLHGEREYRRRDGSAVEVDSSASVIAYGGRRVACTVVHDITNRKRNERALNEKNRQLSEAMEQLKKAQSQLVQSEKLASLGQMVAGVAHEINNPLSFVSNNVAVLQRDVKAVVELLRLYGQGFPLLEQHSAELANEIKELSDQIDLAYTTQNLSDMMDRSRDGLKRIQQIVKDLRDFARLDASDVHDADLNAGIESTVNIIAGLAKKNQVIIDKELSDIPRVRCNPAKINQVVMNLLSNAIDACTDGCHVKIRTAASNGTVTIEVSDTGKGIPPAIRERIFDPFFTTKPPGKGTGLGLSISYGIIRDHGGDIAVDSTPGKGTTCTVKIPVNAK